MPRSPRLLLTAAAAAPLLLSLAPTAAFAGTHHGGSTSTTHSGYDVSYPQCSSALPSGALFGVVGVNDGVLYSFNPCTASELRWAQASGQPAFYANTADPGPAYSSHWPGNGASADGHVCDGSNSADCSFVYGYLGAQNSLQRAAAAEQQLGATNPTAAATSVPWWLDVETGNSWQTLESAYGQAPASRQNDTAALQGAAAALADAGAASVGFYSTGYQWGQITGGTGTTFAADPSWVAGYSSANSATSGCTSTTAFTGGRVALTQYVVKSLDADHACS